MLDENSLGQLIVHGLSIFRANVLVAPSETVSLMPANEAILQTKILIYVEASLKVTRPFPSPPLSRVKDPERISQMSENDDALQSSSGNISF